MNVIPLYMLAWCVVMVQCLLMPSKFGVGKDKRSKSRLTGRSLSECQVTKVTIQKKDAKAEKNGIVVLGSTTFGSCQGGGPHTLALYGTNDVIESISVHVPKNVTWEHGSKTQWPRRLELKVEGENIVTGRFQIYYADTTLKGRHAGEKRYSRDFKRKTSTTSLNADKPLVSTSVRENSAHTLFAFANVYNLKRIQVPAEAEISCGIQKHLVQISVGLRSSKYGGTIFTSHAGTVDPSQNNTCDLKVLECIAEGRYLKSVRNLEESRLKFEECFKTDKESV